MNDDGFVPGLIIGIVIAALIAGFFHPDYVTSEQYLAAEARCAGYGGVEKVESLLQHRSDIERVHYQCHDGSWGKMIIHVGQD